MMGLLPLQKETRENLFPFSVSAVYTDVYRQAGRKTLTKSNFTLGILTLDFPDSQTVRNKLILFKLSSL